MTAQETPISRKKRGPKPTGWGAPVMVRLQPDALERLDAWIAAQPKPRPTRPEAIRRLTNQALRGR